jgi:hypothetical protein
MGGGGSIVGAAMISIAGIVGGWLRARALLSCAAPAAAHAAAARPVANSVSVMELQTLAAIESDDDAFDVADEDDVDNDMGRLLRS